MEWIPRWRGRKLEILMALICCVGFAATGYSLLFSTKDANENTEPMSIGAVRPMGSDIRVMTETDQVWKPVARDTSVFENDKVYTGQNSQAKVELKNNGKLTVEPNSLIVISDTTGKQTVELTSGGLLAETKANEILFIKFKNKEIKISAGDKSTFRVSSHDKATLKLLVLTGEVQVARNTSSPVATIRAKEELEISNNGSVPVFSSIILNSPMPGEKKWSRTQNLEFKWSRSKPGPVFIELSGQPDFKNKVVSEKIDGEIGILKVPQKGIYFWRVVDAKDSSQQSPTSSFSLLELTPPVVPLVSSVEIETNASHESLRDVKFTWNDMMASDSYELELSRDRNFHSLELTKASDSTSVLVSNLKPGDYFWRVRSVEQGRESLNSNTGRIHLIEKTKTLAERALPERSVASEETSPRTSFSRQDPEFWLWGGVGENYQYYEQNVPSLSGAAKFQNVQGPTLYLSVGTQGKKIGAEFTHKETPGEMKAPAGASITNGSFIWKTLTAEGLYKIDDSNFRIRAGMQYHMMPFMVYNATTSALDIKSNSLMLATIGFDKIVPISKKLRGEWLMRYQYPISSGTNSNDSFTVSPIFAFDGSLGTVYSFGENFRLGLFWYGQYHYYKFSYSGSTSFSGEQTLLYSNAELRLGFEF